MKLATLEKRVPVPLVMAALAAMVLGAPAAAWGETCGVDKESICHHPPGNPENLHILCIDEADVLDHTIGHGDIVIGEEVCDGVDNDCDGAVDEEAVCVPCPCGTSQDIDSWDWGNYFGLTPGFSGCMANPRPDLFPVWVMLGQDGGDWAATIWRLANAVDTTFHKECLFLYWWTTRTASENVRTEYYWAFVENLSDDQVLACKRVIEKSNAYAELCGP